MTPERIEEQVTAVVIGINYGRSEKLTKDEEDIIRLALRQCAQEAANEALEKAAEACKGVAQGAIDGLAMGKGTWPKADYVRDELWHRWLGEEMQYRRSVAAIRALKGKP